MKLSNRHIRFVQARIWNSPVGITILLVGTLGVAGGAGFWAGAKSDSAVATERDGVRRELELARISYHETLGRLADAELQNEVTKGALVDLRKSLGALQLELGSVREEVGYYRALLAPSSVERGLQVASLRISATAEAEAFRLELLLTQIEAKRSIVKGRIEVNVVAEADGVAVGLPLSKLQKIDYDPPSYSFRYFQDFSWELIVPPGYQPLRVEVTVVPGGENRKKMLRSFPWRVESA